MTIWAELARAGNHAGDEILLRKRDHIYEIRYNGLELMSNVNFQSETVLAERSLRLHGRKVSHMLIGGLEPRDASSSPRSWSGTGPISVIWPTIH